MNINDFDYELPQELIAQTPLKVRSDSRLLVMDRKTGELKDEVFHNIINYLNKGDCLVLNNTRVIPARIIGTKESTGAVIELLLLKDLGAEWQCLVKPARRIKKGEEFSIFLSNRTCFFLKNGVYYGTIFRRPFSQP